jgi:hypothetical protein
MFVGEYKGENFCGHNILTDGVFVIQMPSNAGISVYELCGLKQIAIS